MLAVPEVVAVVCADALDARAIVKSNAVKIVVNRLQVIQNPPKSLGSLRYSEPCVRRLGWCCLIQPIHAAAIDVNELENERRIAETGPVVNVFLWIVALRVRKAGSTRVHREASVC